MTDSSSRKSPQMPAADDTQGADPLAKDFERGRQAGLEEAAKVSDRKAEEHRARLDKGKGEWPKPDYVRDETWANWHGAYCEALNISAAIRALSSGGKGGGR